MRAVRLSLRIALTLGLLLIAWPNSNGAEPRDGDAAKEAAIRQTGMAYVQALQSRDAEALAAHWTEEGAFVDASGKSSPARELIEKLAGMPAATSAQAPKDYACESQIRFLTDDAAIEEGRCTAEGGAVQFVAIWVNRDGKWLLAHLNERLQQTAEPAGPLEELAWMIGTWIGEGEGLSVTCWANWSENKGFLVRRLIIERDGAAIMTATQRIGWDPATETVRSWTFNSDGSVIKGRWLPMDGAWVVQNTGVLADKGRFNSVNFWIPEGDGRCVLKTSHVERDDEAAAESMIEFRRVAHTGHGDAP